MKYILLIIVLSNVFINAQKRDSLTFYYASGGKESIIIYVDGIRHGDAIFFYEDGNLKRELTYQNGVVAGPVKEYYSNGKLRELFIIEDGRRHGPTSHFDTAGVYIEDKFFVYGKMQEVIDKFKEPPLPPNLPSEDNAPTIITKVETQQSQRNNKREENIFGIPLEIDLQDLENDPAYFFNAEIMPEPIDGWDAFYNRLTLPELARRKKVQGNVVIKAFIDRYGNVTKMETLQPLPYGCTESAEILVYYTRFKPGIIKGKAVNIQMDIEIPFNFK